MAVVRWGGAALGLGLGCGGGSPPTPVPAAAFAGVAPVWVELVPGGGPAAVALGCDGAPRRLRLDPGPPPTWADPVGDAPRPITAAQRWDDTLTLELGGEGAPAAVTLVLAAGGAEATLGSRRLRDARRVGALPRTRPAGCP